MKNEIQVFKDGENQQWIPTVWRDILRNVADALKDGNFQLADIGGVRKLSLKEAQRIAENIGGYGAQLESLPEATWDTSACQWMGQYWDVLVDLYTVEEGASDLVLFVRVYEMDVGYEFDVQSVHVP